MGKSMMAKSLHVPRASGHTYLLCQRKPAAPRPQLGLLPHSVSGGSVSSSQDPSGFCRGQTGELDGDCFLFFILVRREVGITF